MRELTEKSVPDSEGAGQPGPKLRHSQRHNKGVPPNRLSLMAKGGGMEEPTTWQDIERLPADEAEKWRKAATEEIDSLHKNETWRLVELPAGRKTVGCKWVFKVKQDAEGDVQRYKARLVAKGYSQIYGQDYDETFAPVVKHTSIRTLLSMAAAKGMQVEHLDIKTAFLHGEIEEDIYMQQPPGFEEPGKKGLVCKLQKSIYGLKQAARAWNEKLNQLLLKEGFTQGKADPCLYSRLRDNRWTYILTYVDDLILAHEERQDSHEIVQHLNKEIEVKELGSISYYLGIQIEREENGTFLLNQKQKIKDLLECLGLTYANEVSTPMDADF
ncbi:uncharacterized protein LOC128351321 isoform X1 [Hemicordylus capensis]|uniref:uncharacterized protein LOC128351321 isoform X1 n=1 Tax=Hemicordylus capensis TaxID=884348 RepID=UPI0023044281|nr:uncharacterized protein LOC128351321 isoform X1 [Hemicordylus capensis]